MRDFCNAGVPVKRSFCFTITILLRFNYYVVTVFIFFFILNRFFFVSRTYIHTYKTAPLQKKAGAISQCTRVRQYYTRARRSFCNPLSSLFFFSRVTRKVHTDIHTHPRHSCGATSPL